MLYVVIGFLGGIIGGMGLGGGTILIPILVLFLGVNTKIAQSVNLLSSIPMTIIALAVHVKNKNVVYNLVIPIVLFGIVGAMAGSILSAQLDATILKKLFGVLLMLVGVLEVVKGVKGKNKAGGKVKKA
ncbi:MAG: sulfite exporter TauE/SafE family protein [Clostridioides sp.]|jgi:uncharacterized membrane protein YfcA|nr:sulfite exporter TauE/SafE family protein [Clostridioides sp.]